MTSGLLAPPDVPSASPATLCGWRLKLARVVWLLCAGLAFALFLVFIPTNLLGVRDSWLVRSSAVAVARYVSFQIFAAYVLVLGFLVAAVSFSIAAVIYWRKSNDGVALLVALGLILLPTTTFVLLDGAGHIYEFYGPPWHTLLQTARDWLSTFAAHFMVFLFFIFPDGRFVPRWTRWVAWGVPILFGLAFGVASSRLSWSLWFTIFSAWLMLAIIAQIYRYLRVSGPAERRQTKWFVAAIAFGPFWMLIGLFGLWPGLTEPQANLVSLHMQYAWLLFLPLGVGIGVLRRGLWGADPLLNRALVYSGLTLLVLTLYGAIVFGLGAAFGAGGNVLLAVIATGVIAIFFNPLRQRLQRAANRLMYGERDDPASALSRLGQRLEAALAPGRELSTIVETVAQALRVPYVAIEIMEGADYASAAAAGVYQPKAELIPLVYQSQAIGRLVVAPRAPGEAFSAADRRLLNDLARQAAPAVHAHRLTADLQRSRERIVIAREEERRRLRRDLHDGFGPALASQALKLDAALDLLATDPATARRLLGEVKAQTQASVADARQLVYALRPPALDELGLVGALRAQLQSMPVNGLRMTLDAAPLPPLSAAVEVAAYRIALEAVTNIVRHARAGECVVRLAIHAGALELEVTDNGTGLRPGHTAGVGLASMRERAAELGGECHLENVPTGGVRIVARLPLVAAEHG